MYTFSFTGTPSWTCPLVCAQCTHNTRRGGRCKNRVCFGTPLCWAHNKTEYGVKIKKSGEAGSGKGLFATKPFGASDWVCPYVGNNTTKHCIDQWYRGNGVTAPYVECDFSTARRVRARQRVCYDAACKRGIGSMANTKALPGIQGLEIAPKSQQNCVAEVRLVSEGGDGSVWLRTIRKVGAEEELFLFYGNDYLLQNNHATTRRVGRDDAGPPPCTMPQPTRRSHRTPRQR